MSVLLTLDIGNSNVVIGTVRDGTVVHHWRIATRTDRTADEYGVLLAGLFQNERVAPSLISGAALSSVVAPLTDVVTAAIERYIGCSVLVVTRRNIPEVPVLVDEPDSVGIDRLVNLVAALHRRSAPLVVVDFGTATTFDAVSAAGAFLGGAIAPGLGIAAESLFARTAALPRVTLAAPPRAIGTTTVTNIQSGLVYGYAALVDGLVRRFRAEMQTQGPVIATGGLAGIIAPQSETIDDVAPWLTLEGLGLIYERHCSRAR